MSDTLIPGWRREGLILYAIRSMYYQCMIGL
jgi:hypothetical protein